MAISFVGAADAAATSITLPAHAADDLIIISAHRADSSSAITLPAGFTELFGGASSTSYMRVGYKVAASASETSGTWTGAQSIVVAVYRGIDPADPVGAVASTIHSALTGQNTYPALTLERTDNTSWVTLVGGADDATSPLGPPSGTTSRAFRKNSLSETAIFDSNAGVSSWTAKTGTEGFNTSPRISVSVELLEPISAVALTATGAATGSPSTGTPALGQKHGLTATGVATSVGSPALAQVHEIEATGAATSAPTVGSPALAQVHGLEAAGIATSAPSTGSPALTIGYALEATGVAAGDPTVGTPAIAQVHELEATGTDTDAPTVGAPILSEGVIVSLEALDVATSAPSTGTPAIGQAHSLAAVWPDLLLDVGTPALGLVGPTTVVEGGGSGSGRRAHRLSFADIKRLQRRAYGDEPDEEEPPAPPAPPAPPSPPPAPFVPIEPDPDGILARTITDAVTSVRASAIAEAEAAAVRRRLAAEAEADDEDAILLLL